MPRPIQVGRKERMTFAKINEVCEMPNLIEMQTASYDWFIKEGLREVFEDISPIKDYADNLVLEFIDYSLTDAPKYEQEECKERDVTYAAPLKVKVRLINKETGEVKEQEVFMGDFPLMTEKGTFIYNLGTGCGYSVLQVVEAFEKASGVKVPYKIVDRRPGDLATCFSDPSKAKEELGWVAEKGIDEMCADSYRWQHNNPNGYED